MTTSLGRLEDFPIDKPTSVKVDGTSYLVVRRSADGDQVCVVRDKCPHAGLSLSSGPRGGYADGVLTCPWHNSQFDVCTGENLDWAPGFAGIRAPGWSRKLIAMGKSPAGLTLLEVEVRDGEIVTVD